MTVTIYDAHLQNFLRSTNGPVGRDLALRAHNVAQQAAQNATGEIIGIETGDLISGIYSRIEQDTEGLFARVGTTAIHRGFGYPAWHDQHGRPWLTKALRDGFREGI